MPKYTLSNRMAAVAGLVPFGVTACDIGCDHGFVAIYLVEEGISPRVIAMDINRGPLLRAKEHIESVSLSTYIETRLSDGLEKLKEGEAECMIAAGMGGRLIVKIMEDYPEKLRSLRYLVLQPQSELSLVRRCLREKGFEIRREDMVLENGKFYPMMLAEAALCGRAESGARSRGAVSSAAGDLRESGEGKESAAGDLRESGAEKASAIVELRESGEEKASAAEDLRDDQLQVRNAEQAAYRESLEEEFGPCLIEDRHPVLLKYLDWWEGQQRKISEAVSAYPERAEQVEEELRRIRDVRKMMEEERTSTWDVRKMMEEELTGPRDARKMMEESSSQRNDM